MSWHRLRVREVIEETHDARSLVFDVPQELREAFAYRPGQFLTLRIAHESGTILRCYSLSSCPQLDDAPRVTVKRVKDGRGSNWVGDHVAAGDVIEVMAPAGRFTPASFDGDFLLFAGGSGITPVFSILRTLLHAGRGRVFLFYANRDERSVIFREALAKLAREHAARVQVVHWLDSVQGYPTQAQLQAIAEPWRGAQCFICGPDVFMQTAQAALEALAIPAGRIHVERFLSLSDAASEDDIPGAASGEDAAATCRVEVKLDGKHHELQASPARPLLDAMLAAGLDAPYSCRMGHCSSCMCRLREGAVDMPSHDALSADEVADGWILACQARPRGEHIAIDYD